MSKLNKFTLRLAAASVIALVPAGASLADPRGTLRDVPRHQHFIQTPNGDLVRIGPDVCDDPNLQDGFDQFHYNVHHNFGTTPTNGPQGGAPGLHDDRGADITAGGCG